MNQQNNKIKTELETRIKTEKNPAIKKELEKKLEQIDQTVRK